MSRRPAAVTQADIERAIKAAKRQGADSIEVVLPSGGKFVVLLKSVPLSPQVESDVDRWLREQNAHQPEKA
jgi:hypothetical protein